MIERPQNPNGESDGTERLKLVDLKQVLSRDARLQGNDAELIVQTLYTEKDTEIERRFLVRKYPDEGFAFNRIQVIRQGYFKGQFVDEEGVPVEKRLRVREAWHHQQGSRYRLNYKDADPSRPDDKTKRMEHGGKLMDRWFPPLWNLVDDNHLTKVRFYDESNPEFEIHLDVYVAPPELEGQAVVEFEFKSDAAARSFDPSRYPWLDGSEITNLKGWGNASLAIKGLPPNASQPHAENARLFQQAGVTYGIYLAKKTQE